MDHGFVAGYEFFLRSALGCSEVSVAKYIKHLRKVVITKVAKKVIIPAVTRLILLLMFSTVIGPLIELPVLAMTAKLIASRQK